MDRQPSPWWVPRLPEWDGKTFVAAFMLAGYYFIIWKMLRANIPPGNLALIRDQMLVLGPAIGVVVGSIFRTTAADERTAARRSEDLHAALNAPGTGNGAPAPAKVLGAVREGARQGVNQGLDENLGPEPKISPHGGEMLFDPPEPLEPTSEHVDSPVRHGETAVME